jgi:hypothetical protein
MVSKQADRPPRATWNEEKTMAYQSHNHAAYKTAENGRFIIYKNLRLGARGNSGSNFVLEDTNSGAVRKFSSMSFLKCHIVHSVNGLELAPYFGSNAKNGDYKDCSVKPKLADHPEYKEIKG